MGIFSFSKKTGADCREVGKWLQHYLDGEVEDATSQRLAAHLELCKQCGLEEATYRRIAESLASSRQSLDDEALDRLRQFGRTLAHD